MATAIYASGKCGKRGRSVLSSEGAMRKGAFLGTLFGIFILPFTVLGGVDLMVSTFVVLAGIMAIQVCAVVIVPRRHVSHQEIGCAMFVSMALVSSLFTLPLAAMAFI